MTADDDPWHIDDDELDQLLDDLAEVDMEAAGLLRTALADELATPAPEPELTAAAETLRAGIQSERWPFEYFIKACGWRKEPPGDDAELWERAAAATISPPEDPGTDVEEQSAVFALEHADWFGLVTGLVRRGVGAKFDSDLAEQDIVTCPEIEDESDGSDESAVLRIAVTVLSPLWQGLGIVDADDRLTELGWWGLPRALLRVWDDDTA